MRNAVLSLLAYGLCVPVVMAQEVPDTVEFNGTWNVSIQAASGRAHTAKLVLANFAGTWQDVAASGTLAKACKGKKFPVTVQTSQTGMLEFTAWGSSVSTACPDVSATVRPVGAKAMEGTVATGESIKLTRK